MANPLISHIEIPSTNIDKAKDFYAEAEKENKTVLSTPDYDLICNMVEVLYSYNEII